MEKKSLSAAVVILTIICVAIMLYNNSILEQYINNNEGKDISLSYKNKNTEDKVKTKVISNTLYKIPKTVIINKEKIEYENLKMDMNNYYESQAPKKITETYINAKDKEILADAGRKLSLEDYNKIQQYLLLDNRDSIVKTVNLLRDRLTDDQYNQIKSIANKYKN